MHNHRAPRWLPDRHSQTIWPALFARSFSGARPRYRRERWATPDGDFIDVDWQHVEGGGDITLGSAGASQRVVAASATAAATATANLMPGVSASSNSINGVASRPLLVLFHGLEGSSASHYALAFADRARRLGWRYAVPHFRGCSGEINLAPRAYHSGDHEEIGWVLQRMRSVHPGPLVVVGVSLGGNALLRWAEEAGASAASVVSALASVSAPLDLAAGGHAIGRGLNRHIYTRMFLRSMKPKALQKLAQHPGLFDRARLEAARDLHAFDDVFTAPLHGFRDADDYWARGSAKPHLANIRVPTLVLNAKNDPFVPAASLPRPADVGAHVTLWQPGHGGHVGFAAGEIPGHVHALPEAVTGWLQAHL